MSVKRMWLSLAFAFSALGMCAPVQATDGSLPHNVPDLRSDEVGQVVIQIGGRFCEYHREDVEGALRRYAGVRSVEFLNDHGTVLVRYEGDGVQPAQLAESAAHAAFGMGCKAWVDRGGSESPRS